MKIKKTFFKDSFALLVATVNSFIDDKAMKMSAALAYYTLFSLAPLLLIVLWLVGFFFGQHSESQEQILKELEKMVGTEAAYQIQQVIQKIGLQDKSGLAIGIGIVTLVIGSTTVFVQIQDSINDIWKVRVKPKKEWVRLVLNRLLSFSMIIGIGFLLVVSLIVTTIISSMNVIISRYIPIDTLWMVDLANRAITFLVIATLFGVIFRFLPDARIRWKTVRIGAIFTAVLFMLGQYLIGLYMRYSAPASAYGAAGSVIVILLWIYYTSAILYFGAEFTKEFAKKHGGGITPSPYAVRVVQSETVEEEEERTPM
ncbi:membrane protein [bacterium A37T11]|nr:membrane protein [bacterium A37T11]